MTHPESLPCGICGESLETEDEAIEHMQEEHEFPGDDVVFIE